MYKITTPRRLYLVGSLRDVLDYLKLLGNTGLTLKQYLKQQSTL
ncbi:MAG: hypothetical protein ACOX42_04845 [Clostridia bacterium]|jgi:hypothetical protein